MAPDQFGVSASRRTDGHGQVLAWRGGDTLVATLCDPLHGECRENVAGEGQRGRCRDIAALQVGQERPDRRAREGARAVLTGGARVGHWPGQQPRPMLLWQELITPSTE